MMRVFIAPSKIAIVSTAVRVRMMIDFVSSPPKGGVIYEYRGETSQSRTSQQISEMVSNQN